MNRLFEVLDRDRSGSLSLDELYRGLRGEMTKPRLNLVESCWADLVRRAEVEARPHSEEVPVAFLKANFSCDHTDEVKAGKVRFDDAR